MVHALREAWRVLILRGILIDLRPININAPLEIVTSTTSDSAGMVDMGLNIADDIAADNAIQGILRDGIFTEMQADYFDLAYYWNTVKEMKADMDDRWKDDIVITESVLQQAYHLFDHYRGQARVRLRIRKKLIKYEKQ
jgi:hypothetical protein